MKKSMQVYKCKLVKDNIVEYISNIKNCDDVLKAAMKLELDRKSEEYFSMFCLNVKGDIIGYHEISHGDLNATSCSPQTIFKRAILNNASAIILMHNHPSGDPNPSKEDKIATKNLCKCGKMIGIKVIDHIIIGFGGSHFSMQNEGFIK